MLSRALFFFFWLFACLVLVAAYIESTFPPETVQQEAAPQKKGAPEPLAAAKAPGREDPRADQAPGVSQPAGAKNQAQPAAAQAQAPFRPTQLDKAGQVVVVSAQALGSKEATVTLWRRKPTGELEAVGQPMFAYIGQNGLGYGLGLWRPPSQEGGPEKREGDGRTPAGLFAVRQAFGAAKADTARKRGVKLPYKVASSGMVCVSDAASKRYNTLVMMTEEQFPDWSRHDRLARDDGANSWGLVLEHNTEQPVAGAGSCLYLSVWPKEPRPTSGSVGMSLQSVMEMLTFLDPQANPVLVVVPKGLLAKLGLPEDAGKPVPRPAPPEKPAEEPAKPGPATAPVAPPAG